MWEYSVSISNSNKQIASFIFSSSKKFVEELGGVTTLYKDKDFSSVVVAIDDDLKDKVQSFYRKTITRAICTFFKTDFLDKNLCLPIRDEMGLVAFKKALVNFDKETDYYIVAKNLEFSQGLYLESFYNFKLIKLREKWSELISLANENRDYLVNSEAFLDLLKFLIDNIDISLQEIDVVEDDDGYRIFSGTNEESLEGLSCEGLVSSVIDLSPQKINLYCKKENCATELIKKLYEKRVNFKFAKTEQEHVFTFHT